MSSFAASVRIPVPRTTFCYATYDWNGVPCAQCIAPVQTVAFGVRGSTATPCGCRYKAVER